MVIELLQKEKNNMQEYIVKKNIIKNNHKY
jgi:hypothetical protein